MTFLRLAAIAGLLIRFTLGASAQDNRKDSGTMVKVLSAPSDKAKSQLFRDSRYHVSFSVPPGWELTRKDGTVSTFHEDARSAPAAAKLRGVAMLDFNPFPTSTLSGALFYFSVEEKATDVECAKQAGESQQAEDVQEIGGVPFAHGHDEHGSICTEARDEVYTAYHRHTCYRFDLAMNTFCSVSSGAREITEDEVTQIDQRMTQVLSTVTLGWEKSGANFVPVPAATAQPKPKAVPQPAAAPNLKSGV